MLPTSYRHLPPRPMQPCAQFRKRHVRKGSQPGTGREPRYRICYRTGWPRQDRNDRARQVEPKHTNVSTRMGLHLSRPILFARFNHIREKEHV
jgi:hypothetical protein